MSKIQHRSSVFISYSRQDSHWLERLRTHLRPLERDLQIDIWDDTKINAGSIWRDEIGKALKSAQIAVLLISADFIASDFIINDELPSLLRAAQEEGTIILPVIISPSRFLRTSNISLFQAANDPAEPLVGMSARQQEEVLDKVAQRIEDALAQRIPIPNKYQDIRSGEENSFLEASDAEESMRALLATYYRCLAEECRHLPLGTIAAEYITKRDEDRISLSAIYVRLDVQNAERDQIETDTDARTWALRLAIGDQKNRVPLLDAITKNGQRFHVILGEGGSGKTSFINYLTFLLADSLPDSLPGLSSHEESLPEVLQGLLPFHLVLREVAAKYIPNSDSVRGSAEMFWNALLDDMRLHLGESSAQKLLGFLQQRMLREGALVLFDGLDEVSEVNHRRRILLEAIRDLVNVLDNSKSRFLVTARPYAYVDPQWQLEGFMSWSLAPFNELQAQEFIHRWYRAVRPSFGWSEDTAEVKSNKLQFALKDRAYLGELAGRPLFLTLMAALHSNRGQLPEDRAELYEETVRLMLSRWQRAREVRGSDGEMVTEPGITESLKVGEARLRTALERLAYVVHERQGLKLEARNGPADISRGEVLEAFEPLFDSIKLQTLLNYLENRAGLLIERKSGVFAFPHRSFQEYLSACHCAEEPDFPEGLVARVNSDHAWWRETFLLAVGKARRGSLRDAVSVISTLVPEGPDPDRVPKERHWQNAILAGEALIELRLLEHGKGREHYEALLKVARRWLVDLIQKEALSPAERLKAGDTLGRLRDPRKGVGPALGLLDKECPDFDWVKIDAGDFIMGSSRKDLNARANELPAHNVFLPEYYLARFPVTNAQFRLFIEDGGYAKNKYWSSDGWAWAKDDIVDFTPIPDERLRERYRKWMSRRPKEKFQPDWWGDFSWGAPTRPVIGVNWYEAMAFASWVDDVYRRICPSLMIGGLKVRLPTEAEWEKAARGTTGHIWPWGDERRVGVSNTKEEGLEKTSPVGIFPSGASPFGVLDMAGNVWEWTITRWGYRNHLEADYNYPYNSNDGRENEAGTHIRIVRGSSWFGNLDDFARCSFRGWGFAFNASTFSGFRLALAPAIPTGIGSLANRDDVPG